jgi:hypothetical protein
MILTIDSASCIFCGERKRIQSQSYFTELSVRYHFEGN